MGEPLIVAEPALVLERRLLVFSPVTHIVRGLMFVSGGTRDVPHVFWFLFPTFAAPGSWTSVFKNELNLGSSDAPAFADLFERQAVECITRYLRPAETVQQFYDLALDNPAFMWGDLRAFPSERATALAALGQFDAAASMLPGPVLNLEQRGKASMERALLLLAKKRTRNVGEIERQSGEFDLRWADRLQRLLSCLKILDPTTIAGLLREWEAENVKRWGVDHLWEPTPFPFEST